MIYLSGCIKRDLIERPDLGFLMTPARGGWLHVGARPWAADSDAFNNPDRFPLPDYLRWLDRAAARGGTCLFATVPDVVGNAEATLDLAAPVLPLIRQAGVRAALVAQDGLEALTVPWDTFDCLFLGGTTAWKLSHHARDLTAEAKRRGKWVHMGRVNSLLRMRTAAMWGCDSVDGTQLAFRPDRYLPQLLGWLDTLRAAPTLNFGIPHAA